MEQTLQILQYLGPFIGVFVGWFLSQRSEKKKTLSDEKSKIRHTLFLLLEVRNELINVLKEDSFLKVYVRKIKEKFNVSEPTKEERKAVSEFISKLKIELKTKNKVNKLENQISICVYNLSEIDPLLASRINGNHELRQAIKNWEIQSMQIISLEDINSTAQILEHFAPKVVGHVENILNDIIISVAKLTDDKKIIEDTSELIHRKWYIDNERQIAKEVEMLIDEV